MNRAPFLTAAVLGCVFAGVPMTVAQVMPINYLAQGVDLTQGHNDLLIAAALDEYLGPTREVITFDDVLAVRLDQVGQTDSRFLDQGVLFEVIAPPVIVAGDMNCVLGGCLDVSYGVPSRVRIRFVKTGTLDPTTVTTMGVWTTTPDKNENCLEFFDGLDNSLGIVCAQAESYYPLTDVEFIGGQYAGGIGYVDVFTPSSAVVGFEVDLLSIARNLFVVEVDSATLSFGRPGADGYSFRADYELGQGSDGMFPDLESVTVSFGTHTQRIPAGAFACIGHVCHFHGTGSGITAATITDGAMEFLAEGIDLSDTENPVRVAVAVGNDSGEGSIRLRGTLHRRQAEGPGVSSASDR